MTASTPSVPSDPSAQRTEGPLHNQIPEPDRTKDNSTLWRANYDQAYYGNLYFNRMKSFYNDQSSGRYSINGEVTDWVKVPFNEARYGTDACGSIVCCNVWFLIRDAMSIWVQDQLDSGMTMEQIQAYLAEFDVQDRYDYDNDGNFREPDGFIDHFQIVHAGGDEADGDPIYGTDAIWSHRGNAGLHPPARGPTRARPSVECRSVRVVSATPAPQTVASCSPTTRPACGSTTTRCSRRTAASASSRTSTPTTSGLPDEYDTSGNTGGAENSTGFWTLMSQSRGTAPGDPGIGDRPMPMSAWDKLQLGWLDYDVVHSGRTIDRTSCGRVRRSTGDDPNGLVVLLPDKNVTFQYGAPCAGVWREVLLQRQGRQPRQHDDP